MSLTSMRTEAMRDLVLSVMSHKDRQTWELSQLRSEIPLLITGASGTGKSQMARFWRPQGVTQFIECNLGTLSESLFESELFGHEKGAFTDAHAPRAGRLSEASEGVLFLDEIAELGPKQQLRLLELLQERRFYRIGSSKPLQLSALLVFATQWNLAELVAQGRFRADLFFRLRGWNLRLPTLSQIFAARPPERDPVLQTYLLAWTQKLVPQAPALSSQTLLWLGQQKWPGNWRDLRQALEIAGCTASFENSHWIEIRHFPDWCSQELGPGRVIFEANPSGKEGFKALSYHEALERFEEWFIRDALARQMWKVNQTARATGLSKNKVIQLMRKWGLRAAWPRPRHSASPEKWELKKN